MLALYEEYKKFSAWLREKHGHRSPEPSYESFVRWWDDLDEEVRSEWKQLGFQAGYERLMERAEKRLEARANQPRN